MSLRRRHAEALALGACALLACASPRAAGAADAGAKLYAEHCVTCHEAGGAGIAGFGSPLAGPAGARVRAKGGREYLAQVMVHGIAGIFELDGQRQFAAMPPAAASDEQLAAVLNYVIRELSGATAPADFAAFTPAEIAAARGANRTQRDLHRLKQELEKAAR